VPGRIDAQEPRLQDLQRISVGYQQDVTAGVPSLQVRDERGRPVQHGGHGLDVAVRVPGVFLVGCPDARVAGGRRPFPLPEAPFAETASAAPRCARTTSAVCLAREKSEEQMTVPAGKPQPLAAASACWRPCSVSP
jgi:hypothetical protein